MQLIKASMFGLFVFFQLMSLDNTYSGGGLPRALHLTVMAVSKWSTIMGPDVYVIMVGGCSTMK